MKDGERIISDFSTPSLREAALSFEDQYKERKSRAGSANKKKQGIWQAVCEIRAKSPDMDADAVWENLDGMRVAFKWELWIDDDRVSQIDLETNKSADIKFSTFVRHYYSKAMKK